MHPTFAKRQKLVHHQILFAMAHTLQSFWSLTKVTIIAHTVGIGWGWISPHDATKKNRKNKNSLHCPLTYKMHGELRPLILANAHPIFGNKNSMSCYLIYGVHGFKYMKTCMFVANIKYHTLFHTLFKFVVIDASTTYTKYTS